jgi:DNA polymerase II large subunit
MSDRLVRRYELGDFYKDRIALIKDEISSLFGKRISTLIEFIHNDT